MEHKMTNNRKAEKAKLQQQLAKIHNNVKRLQQQLKDVKPTPEFVEKLREMMEEVEKAIHCFKEEQRLIYEELIKEEKTATNELSALEKKIDTWALSRPATERAYLLPSGKVPVDTMLQNHLPKEVLEFERFLQQTGGRQGDWDDYDHQHFLKVWTKHKGKPAYVEEALEYLSGRTKEDIQQHGTWYQEFLILEERKKESIQKWKVKKQQEKQMLKEKQMSEEMLKTEDLQKEAAKKQKVEEERKKQQSAVKAWKRRKEIEFARKQASQLKEEEEKEKRQQKKRQCQFQLKLLLENYTRQKEEQEASQRLEKEKRDEADRDERKRIAAEEIPKFQKRDLRKLELKILEKQAKEKEKIEREKKLAKLKRKVEVHVTRDPSRLYKPTKGWEERTKDIGPTDVKPLLYIPHRAIPTWRQGL
ncbi:coiled-coil domain-containing protein 112 isoform X2 [Carettochelys insculpta]